jgi:hypothetical protein
MRVTSSASPGAPVWPSCPGWSGRWCPAWDQHALGHGSSSERGGRAVRANGGIYAPSHVPNGARTGRALPSGSARASTMMSAVPRRASCRTPPCARRRGRGASARSRAVEPAVSASSGRGNVPARERLPRRRARSFYAGAAHGGRRDAGWPTGTPRGPGGARSARRIRDRVTPHASTGLVEAAKARTAAILLTADTPAGTLWSTIGGRPGGHSPERAGAIVSEAQCAGPRYRGRGRAARPARAPPSSARGCWPPHRPAGAPTCRRVASSCRPGPTSSAPCADAAAVTRAAGPGLAAAAAAAESWPARGGRRRSRAAPRAWSASGPPGPALLLAARRGWAPRPLSAG